MITFASPDALAEVTEDKQLNSAVLIALSEGAEVTQESPPLAREEGGPSAGS